MPGTILPATKHHTLHQSKCQETSSQQHSTTLHQSKCQEPSSWQQSTTLCTNQNAWNHPPSNTAPHSAPIKMPGTILPATKHHTLHQSKCQEPSSQQQSTTLCNSQNSRNHPPSNTAPHSAPIKSSSCLQ